MNQLNHGPGAQAAPPRPGAAGPPGPVVRPLGGSGLIAHAGGMLLACEASDDLTDRLLEVLRSVSQSGGTGRHFIRGVAQVLADSMSTNMASCAVAGPVDGGAAVLVSGSAAVTVTAAEGAVTLGGQTSLTWADRFIAGPVRRIELRLPHHGPADPRCRLDSGIVTGGGVEWLADQSMVDQSADQSMARPGGSAAPRPAHAAGAQPLPPIGYRPEAPTPQAIEPLPDHVRPEHGHPQPGRPEDARPGHAQPGHAQPGHAQPGHAQPGHVQPGNAQPGHAYPGHVRPEQARPEQARPEQARPEQARPEQARPEQGRPGQGQPVHLGRPQPGHVVPEPAGTQRPAPGDIPPDDIRSQPFESVLLIPPGGEAAAPPAPTRTDPEPDARPEVWGGDCKNGHFNDPRSHYCALCGIGMAQLTIVPRRGPRPPLGMLLLDDGMALRLDTDYLMGRDPERAGEVTSGQARPARIADQSGSVSRRHLRVLLHDWDVQLVDLGSVNGTYVLAPGESEYRQIPARQPVTISPGTMVRLGASRHFRYESHRKN